MKAIKYTMIIIMLGLTKISSAAMFVVNVEDFEFGPENFTCSVGDTVMWIWDRGTHTTTSTDIPAGAASWSSPVDNSTPVFMYAVTVPGVYDYQCNYHYSMGMVGHFNATGTTGISTASAPHFRIENNLVNENLGIRFSSTGEWNIRLMNIAGEQVKNFSGNTAAAGRTEYFPVPELPAGIYIVSVTTGKDIRTERIVKR